MKITASQGIGISKKRRTGTLLKNYQLYIFIMPVLAYYVIFHYWPMYGVQIAFKDYNVVKGFWGSPWVGFIYFEQFFNSFEFKRIITNTLSISALQLTAGFPLPIIFALLLNHLTNRSYKKFVQTVVYAPHFISIVVLVSLVFVFLSPRTGLVNHLIKSAGGEPIFFIAKPEWFRPLYVLSGIWQNTGWSAIIYLAALTSISPELHEAAIVDGCSKLQRIWYIDVPGIMPTAVILLILNTGNIMSIGFEKAFLMQNALNLSASEIISTYVYKAGLLGAQFSFSTAVGLFNSMVNFILLITVNRISGKLSSVSLW